MTLVKFAPMREIEDIQKQIHKYFYDHPALGSYDKSFSPKIDMVEDENSFLFDVEIPGVNKNDIKITLQDNILTVEGERKKSNNLESDKVKCHCSELQFGSFKRSFKLPANVDREKVEAKFENGILNISLEKYIEKSKKEKIIEVK